MKLHLGSGKIKLNGWLNVDLDAAEADMHLDLTAPLPFEDQSVSYIFNEHFIEHVTREEAGSFLKEAHRVLKVNGIIRLSTPDLKYLAISYLSKNINEWGELWQPANPCLFMNEGMRFWGHHFLYDAEELVRTLLEVGYSSVRFVNWGESSIHELIGLESRPYHHELIIEAKKSGHLEEQNINISKQDIPDSWGNCVDSTMLKHIKVSEQVIADQLAQIANLHRATSNQAAHILCIEAELIKMRASWYEKLKSIVRKIRNL